ncbi:MAG: hypothetical protein JWL84_5526 [Rhodospirillales bacterium]|nr:hypothetical protein [Rhodospirillales bacterium]
MRDMRADWKRWSQGERVAAIVIAAFIAAAPTVALIVGA